MRTIIPFIVVLLLSSCTLHKITERRTKRNLTLVHDVSAEILQLHKTRFEVDTLKDKTLRKKLKKLNAAEVEVYALAYSDYDDDSVIVFSKYQFFLTEGQIVFDFRKSNRAKLESNKGLNFIKIDDRVYFRRKPIPFS